MRSYFAFHAHNRHVKVLQVSVPSALCGLNGLNGLKVVGAPPFEARKSSYDCLKGGVVIMNPLRLLQALGFIREMYL